jgi:exosome complex exonuclease DIS3/RRP44
MQPTTGALQEFMLLANISVATHIQKHYPSTALLRRHTTPPAQNFERLTKLTSSRGLLIKTGTSKELADSLDAAVDKSDRYLNHLLRIVTTRCMTQAQYFAAGETQPSEFNHYGLAAPIYTHFTSPIRRYADVLVHRLLAASLGIDPVPDSLAQRTAVADGCTNLNMRHKNAQLAGRASVELHTLIFFKGKSEVQDAYVLSVHRNGFTVLVPRYGIEGNVYLNPKVPPPPQPDPTRQVLSCVTC